MTDPLRVIGIDPANLTGFCWSNGTIRLCGTWRLSGPDGEHPGMRLSRLRTFLTEFLAAHPADKIAYEDAHYGSVNHLTAAMHAELRGVIRLVAAEANLPCVAIHPTSIKSFATGNGRAEKWQMVRAAKTFFGIECEDDNQADSLFIAELGRQERVTLGPAKVKRKKAARIKGPQARLFR